MTHDQLDLIPDRLLKPDRQRGAVLLIDWLHRRGWHMSLLELETERRRRTRRSGS